MLAIRSATPLAGSALDDLLDRFEVARSSEPSGAESELVLRLPAVEADATPVLLRHGFRPRATTAIKPLAPLADPPSTPEGLTIREAATADRERIVDLLVQMHASDVSWGGGFERPDQAELFGQLTDAAIARPGWTWVAERAGRLVGVASLQSADEASWAAPSTSLDPITYFGLLAVDEDARGAGVGRALAETAHLRAIESGAVACLLDHASLSPLSSTFWHRQGYRPLWTTWVSSAG